MGRYLLPAFLLPLLLFFQGVSIAQSSIPARYDGFPYGDNLGIANGIIVEAFLDPLCPDSRDSWPPLKKVLLEYHPRLSLLAHPFPLPYHDNSFVACRALHIANMLNVSATYPLLELFFKYQEKYYNGPTKNLSREAIVDDISRLGAEAVGNSLLPAFKDGFINPHSDSATRTSFKSDYLRKISLKMLSMETKTQQKTPMNPLPGVNQNSTDAGVVGEAGNSRGGRSQKRPQQRRLKKWPRKVTHYGRNKFCNWTTYFCCIVMASNVISTMAVPSILLWLCFPPSSFTGDISIGILSEFVVCYMSFI